MKYNDGDISPVFPYLTNADGTISKMRYTIFIRLSLDKKCLLVFFKIEGYKDRRKEECKMYKPDTLEDFSQYSCHVPYLKLESGNLALCMLNELNRGHDSLYNVLAMKINRNLLQRKK